jgi:aquaporin Z
MEDTIDRLRPREAVKQDRPLSGMPHPFDKLHPLMYASELLGTALLVFLGLSIVIAFWGRGAPLTALPIPPGARRLLTGFLFGSVGAAIAFSPIGKMSGAHINPAVTFAFWLEGKLRWRDASFYTLAQLIGAALGAAALIVWGTSGSSDAWGASLPMKGVPYWLPIAGEAFCTFLLVLLIFIFAAHKTTQPFTPLVNPPLFAVLTGLRRRYPVPVPIQHVHSDRNWLLGFGKTGGSIGSAPAWARPSPSLFSAFTRYGTSAPRKPECAILGITVPRVGFQAREKPIAGKNSASPGYTESFAQQTPHQQTKPPSTMRSTPVQKEAAWLDKKTAGPTNSSTVAIRPIGVSASNCLVCHIISGRRFIGVAV